MCGNGGVIDLDNLKLRIEAACEEMKGTERLLLPGRNNKRLIRKLRRLGRKISFYKRLLQEHSSN